MPALSKMGFAMFHHSVVAETAFTNTLFVAMPDEAAANGDYLLPTVFHSGAWRNDKPA